MHHLLAYQWQCICYSSIKGDTAALQELINIANELVEKDYTADSWQVLQEAIDAANKVISNENVMQEEVDAAYARLQDAVESLEAVKKLIRHS